jgi:hypothetical protein
LLASCETPPAAAPAAQARPSKIDSQRIQEDVAMYLGRPLHKAFFINTSGTRYYANWSGHPEDDAQTATDHEAARCRGLAPRFKADPSRCTPIYIDEQKVLDWSIYQ